MLDRIVDGRTDLVFDYVAAGNAASTTDGNGTSLIRWCAYYGDVSAIRHLLSQGETLASLGDNLDLSGAAFHGHWRLCQYLIECGADANHAAPDTGETPLHAALSKANRLGAEAVVTVLLAAGADPNKPAASGAETASFMRDCRTRGETALHRAAAYADEAVLDLLIDAGARKELRDQYGDTPLSWASLHLRPSAVLRKLCFGPYKIHPSADWKGDHGVGWSGMDVHLLGKPHL